MTASSFRLPTPPGPRAALVLVLVRVARGLREALLAVVRPSLVRRLLVAQLALLMLLWVLGIAYLLHQGGRAFLLLQSKQIYPTILAIADDTDSTPERRRQALDLLHASIVEEYDTSPERQPAILVTRGTQVLYRSRNAPEIPPLDTGGALVTVSTPTQRLHARTVAGPHGLRATMFGPNDGWNLLRTIYSDGFYLMPLLASLPLLVLPAWLSIRLAMRPWTAVAREVARRGPQELAPLAYRDGHRELALMVDAINGWMRRVAESAQRERSFFLRTAQKSLAADKAQQLTERDFIVVLPAFVVGELSTAFQIGFLIFLPFLVIDLIVASALMSLGMMMLSPTIISMPFKLLLFVLVDGWALTMGSLASSFVS